MRDQSRKLRVAVVFGSRSVEHEVSIISAIQAMDAMDPRRFEPLPIYITKEGRWITGPELRRIDSYKDQSGLVNRCRSVYLRPEPFGNRLFMEELGPFGTRRTRVTVVDVVFPLVHGTYGEDGTLQGLFELAALPYVGAGVVGSAVGMDKIVMKAAFQAQGLPVVNYLWFTRKRWQSATDEVADEVERTLTYPLFVKPANLGSSVGITKANDRAGLFDAVEVAAHYDRRLLVEEAFEGGIEVNCSVLGNDDPQPSVCEQPIAWTEILSYEDKYLRGGKAKGGSAGAGMASLTRRIPAPDRAGADGRGSAPRRRGVPGGRLLRIGARRLPGRPGQRAHRRQRDQHDARLALVLPLGAERRAVPYPGGAPDRAGVGAPSRTPADDLQLRQRPAPEVLARQGPWHVNAPATCRRIRKLASSLGDGVAFHLGSGEERRKYPEARFRLRRCTPGVCRADARGPR